MALRQAYPDSPDSTDTHTPVVKGLGVLGWGVGFYGPGVVAIPLANRATLGNMSPEYG
ncbi:hypothetical protein [Arthrobacter sp. lap29]|uniref:hypothetical protein n=1 Tax=Arthrobacter sp. lap29 TaxID=3056122 RepID=UPI0028F6CEA7|nr:hypothetical protein [Arthrobacter sp. lap29]